MTDRQPPHLDIRVAMLRRGLTVTEVARRVGRGRTYVSAVLSGLAPMSRPLAADLAALLDLDAKELLHDKEAVR